MQQDRRSAPGAGRHRFSRGCFASRNQTWQIEDHADINGGQIGAGARLDVAVGSLAVDKGTSLYSGSDAAAVDRSLQLTATQGDLQLGSAS
jgi:hypothetical protein